MTVFRCRFPRHGALVLAYCLSSGAAHAGQPPATEPVTINDNRAAAGTLAAGTLTVRLDARLGRWHPDRESDPGIVVKAFAANDGPLLVPGPMLRVREGTEIKVQIRNSLSDPLVMHGLHARPAAASGAEAITIAPGATREIAFQPGQAGTYYYWGATAADTLLPARPAVDTQLVGALIVDPQDGPPADDRVLLVSNWPTERPAQGVIGRMVINGRSWPHTERLAYKVGDTVRMRLINAGAAVHPMHLHGFYFKVDSRGDGRSDTVFPPGSTPRMVVTERLTPGRTFSLTWKPTRPGNWLFHCHDNVHLERGVPLDGGPAPTGHRHVENHALEMMAGPVMGITVSGKSIEKDPSASLPRRQLRLVARVDQGGTEAEPAFGYTLHTGSATDAPPRAVPAGPDNRAEARRAGQHHRRQRAARAHRGALARHRARELLRRRRGLCGRGQADRAGDPGRRIVRGALHAAALGHVHLSHARRRGAAACRRASPARCWWWTTLASTIPNAIS